MSQAETAPPAEEQRQLTAFGATVLGIGAMIGAGIFALLGEAGSIAGAAVWMSFLLGALVTSLLAYVCVKLGMKWPSSGGLITFVEKGFGKGRVVGITAWLGYIAASVITCSMVAVSFGSYATTLFIDSDNPSHAWDNIFTTLLVVMVVLINMVGATFVARAQSLIVGLVLLSFAVFIVVTLPSVDFDLLSFDEYPSFSKIISSVALTFFAYMGFNVITFAAGDLKDPERDLPRAMTQAISVTGLTYVLIAVCVFGVLTVSEVITYGETAIAEAARPELGDAGFTLMAATALLSTAGATNAMLYAASNLTGALAKDGFFPPFFGAGGPLGKRAGLLITAAIVLIVANLVDLSAIASVGSAVALVLFLFVGTAGWRRRADTNSNPVVILLAFAVTFGVLGFFAVDTARNAPETFAAIVVVVLLAVAIEVVWSWYRDNRMAPQAASTEPTT
jgi:amino acid transporter